jgi:hypothetical protein
LEIITVVVVVVMVVAVVTTMAVLLGWHGDVGYTFESFHPEHVRRQRVDRKPPAFV